jgi:hypothetical protein
MDQTTIAAASVWALVLLCLAIYRSGQWRVAIPIASVAMTAPPVRAAAANDDEDPPAAEEPARRRFRLPFGLAGAVMATAALRISVLVVLGR